MSEDWESSVGVEWGRESWRGIFSVGGGDLKESNGGCRRRPGGGSGKFWWEVEPASKKREIQQVTDGNAGIR